MKLSWWRFLLLMWVAVIFYSGIDDNRKVKAARMPYCAEEMHGTR